jgi:hypothetical protein
VLRRGDIPRCRSGLGTEPAGAEYWAWRETPGDARPPTRWWGKRERVGGRCQGRSGPGAFDRTLARFPAVQHLAGPIRFHYKPSHASSSLSLRILRFQPAVPSSSDNIRDRPIYSDRDGRLRPTRVRFQPQRHLPTSQIRDPLCTARLHAAQNSMSNHHRMLELSNNPNTVAAHTLIFSALSQKHELDFSSQLNTGS